MRKAIETFLEIANNPNITKYDAENQRYCIPRRQFLDLVQLMRAANQFRDKDGNLPAHAWPGGYPIFYFTADGGPLCPDCANCDEEKRAEVEAGDVNWEDPELYCDNCSKRIESAYAEED